MAGSKAIWGVVLGMALAGQAWAADGADAAATREAKVAARMQALSGDGAQLRTFLQGMPKGGDLHNHLGGSNYAEDFLRWADQDDFCLNITSFVLAPPPCGEGQVSARGLATSNAPLYSHAIDALSMRNYAPTPAVPSGHDQFFSTFARFSAIGKVHLVDAIVATLEQAARDHVGYVEIMVDPEQTFAAGKDVMAQPWKDGEYAASFQRLQGALPGMVKAANESFARTDADIHRQMRCGQRDASIGCRVQYRYLTFVLRTLPPPSVFGQMAFNYALVHDGHSRFVGVNIVAPEDNPVALRDYGAHMAMFRYLSSVWPDVKLTLHAGELSEGLVPPADMRFHIHDAVAAGASRIGHGVDVAYEDDAHRLLDTMHAHGVAVEVNLTSNDVILGVKGRAHPLHMYLDAGVPVVLSTDDEGVSRIDLTHEYQRAVTEQGLDYATLKQIARNGVIYAFLPGQSLWMADGRTPGRACAASLVAGRADAACAALLKGSDKARVQWQLERDFDAFETAQLQEAR